jgi:restriction endonuclease S subunit
MINAVVAFSELYRNLRIDAEFYKPEYLSSDSALKKTDNIIRLRSCCDFIKKGIFDISPEEYTDNGIPLIRTSEIKSPLIDFSTSVFLDPTTHQEHYKTELKPNDIVITKIGAYIGDVALLPSKYQLYNFSQNVTGLSVKKEFISPAYLLAFLLSEFGRSQLIRIIMLSGQGKIELEDIRNMVIYQASDTFQEDISDKVKNAQSFLNQSKVKYKEAQTLLLSELGLTDWQPKHSLSFVKNYSDTEQAKRLDAEYFQPKYEEIVEAIQSYPGGWDTLGNLVEVKKCVEVGSEAYLDKGIPFIRVSNLSPFEITEEKYISEKLYREIRKHQPKQGEILFSKDATPGIAYYLNAQPKQMIPSGGILRLKIKTEKITGEYLTLVLNSILTKEQIKRDVGGSVILHWRPDQVKEIVIPVLSRVKQSEIQQKVTESFNLRKQSKHLLECAKRAVELAIEQDEQTAMDWLEKETGAVFTGLDSSGDMDS